MARPVRHGPRADRPGQIDRGRSSGRRGACGRGCQDRRRDRLHDAVAGACITRAGAQRHLPRRLARQRRAQDADEQNRPERRRGPGADHAHGMVSADAREAVRRPPGACPARRPGAARRHDDTAVEPYRGVLKTFGMLPGAMRGLPFDWRVEELLADRDDLAPIVRPMLAAWRQLCEQVAAFDKGVRALAKASPTCRLLMSVPGIGPLTTLAFRATLGRPDRFRRPRDVGAHLGLTPKRYQSGETDVQGRISRCGGELARTRVAVAQAGGDPAPHVGGRQRVPPGQAGRRRHRSPRDARSSSSRLSRAEPRRSRGDDGWGGLVAVREPGRGNAPRSRTRLRRPTLLTPSCGGRVPTAKRSE